MVNICKTVEKHLKKLSPTSLEPFIAELCKLKAPRGCKPIQREFLKGKNISEISKDIINSYTTKSGPAKIIEALKNSNNNQIRLDLQKAMKAGKTKKKAANNAKAVSKRSAGQVSGADQNQNVRAGENSMASKSQQPGEDIKPKKGQKAKTEPKSMEKPTMKMQKTGGAVGGKRKREEQNGENIKPKKPRKQDKEHFVIGNRKQLINSIASVEPVLDDLLDEKLLTQEQYDIVQKKGTNQQKMRQLYEYVRGWGPNDYDKFQEILKKHNPVPVKNLLEKPKQTK